MLEKSCYCRPFGGRHRLLAALSILSLSVGFARGIISGDPPEFTSNPQDQFVFEIDADGNPVTLTIMCPVTGSGPPNITWYRSEKVDDQFTAEDGSYVFPNITATDTDHASGVGVEFYCTATNAFGTIRSPTVRAFYAAFAGFEEGDETPPGTEPDPTPVDVIVAEADGRQQWVALECALNPGSTPKPIIEWVQRDGGAGGTETVLEEDFNANRFRFIDDGQWLILETTSDAVTGKEYFCRVTNRERFQTARGPTTYTLNAVTEFDVNVHPNGVRVSKQLTNKTAPRVASDAVLTDLDLIAFGTGLAYGGTMTFFHTWTVNGRTDNRVNNDGSVGSVRPSFLLVDDDNPLLRVTLTVAPDPGITLEAYLHLLDPAVIVNAPKDKTDILTGVPMEFQCSVKGNPLPTVTWYFNGDLLEGDDERMIAGDTLTIPSTAVDHSGMYQCVAENEFGVSAVESWTLQVRAPVAPVITTSYSGDADPCLGYHLIQQDTAPVVLVVNITADPCPDEVTWYLNDTEITTDDNFDITGPGDCTPGVTPYTLTLTVENLNDNTQGFYRVSISNVAGAVDVPASRVTGRVRALILDLRSEPDSPIPDSDNNAGCLLAGSEVKIVCENIAFPVGTVMFVKDSTEIVADERVTQSCDILTISSVEQSDSGSYVCRVQNDLSDPQAEDVSSAINLEYCIAPAIVGDLIFSKNNPEEGEETVASCTWTGDPQPTVTWWKDGVVLEENDLPSRFRITMLTEMDGSISSELQIDSIELEDTGDYTCNVRNPVGFDFQVKRLEVQEKKELPLSRIAIIGIAAGGAGFIVLLAVVVVLLCCVYQCAKRGQGGEYVVPGTKNNVSMTALGPETFNVDAPDGPEEEPEAFNPDYASLPALRPAQPPQYKPTPNYPMDIPQDDFQKLPPSDDDFVGPYGHDNGGMHPYPQPTVDDFVSDDAQFV